MIVASILKTSLILAAVCFTGGYAKKRNTSTKLTPAEIDLVQHTWKIVEKHLIENGIFLFTTYFKRYPYYQTFFTFENVPVEDLPHDKKFRSVVKRVFKKLTAINNALGDETTLIKMLHHQGRLHTKLKIPISAFVDLRSPTMDMLQHALGPRFTDDVKSAFDKALTVIVTGITEVMPKNAPTEDWELV